jgi:ribonuclease HI
MIIHIDGAARGNPGPSGYGVIAFNDSGDVIDEAFGYLGEQTNNVAEYCGLIAALELARFRKWQTILVKSDSQLLVRQINGVYKVKNTALKELYTQIVTLKRSLSEFRIEHVRREQNKDADRLANIAVDTMESKPNFINPMLEKPIDQPENYRLDF